VITHSEIFRKKSDLPSFNSNAIEVALHRIPGLSRRFLYFNDDFMLTKNVTITDFWNLSNGTYKIFVDKWLYNGTERCW